MSSSENCTSHDARWSAAHGKRVVRGWLAFVLVVVCSPRWSTRQAALVPGGICARVLGLVASVGASANARSRARGGVHRLRVLSGLVPLVCGVLLMLAALPPEALASTNWATSVEASLPANAATTRPAAVGSVSCASAGNCSAVGYYTDSSGYYHGLLLTETSGGWAAGVEPSLPANAATHPGVQVSLVSCASAGNCAAVGQYYPDSSAHYQGLLLTETSGRWVTGVEASLPANAGTNPNLTLGSVSCASAGNCTAVGSYDDSSGYYHGLLLTETSGRWATGVEAPLPANADTTQYAGGGAALAEVSCASAGNCTAVGGYNDSSGTPQGLLLTETSGTWGTGVEASLPATAGRSPNATVVLVSCASAGNCTAVGGYNDSSGHSHGLLMTETSGTWATGVEASLPASTNPDFGLASLSCASAGNCTAVGSYHDSSGREQGLLVTERSGTWAAGVEAPLPANAGANPDAQVSSVSCVSAGNCTAVGDYDFGGTSSRGLLLTETSGTWATGVDPPLPANARTPPDASVTSVSCASAGNCTAVGLYGPSKGFQGLLLTETPGGALALIGSPTSNAAGVTDKLICAPSALRPCQATETLTTTEATEGGRPVALSASTKRKSRAIIVATKTEMIRPGKKVTVTVKLNATGRKLLARFAKLPVTLTITLLQNGKHLAIANTKLTVKPKHK